MCLRFQQGHDGSGAKGSEDRGLWGSVGGTLALAEAKLTWLLLSLGLHFLKASDPQPGETLGKDLTKIFLLLQRNHWNVSLRTSLVLSCGESDRHRCVFISFARCRCSVAIKSESSGDRQFLPRLIGSDKLLELTVP